MIASQRIDFANTLRGLAALAVVVSHYFGVFWLNRSGVGHFINAPELPVETLATPSYINWINTLSPGWGGYGVALFFIISGFVIPFSLAKSSAISFCVNRLFRIFPTYFAGFSITLLALFVSVRRQSFSDA